MQPRPLVRAPGCILIALRTYRDFSAVASLTLPGRSLAATAMPVLTGEAVPKGAHLCLPQRLWSPCRASARFAKHPVKGWRAFPPPGRFSRSILSMSKGDALPIGVADAEDMRVASESPWGKPWRTILRYNPDRKEQPATKIQLTYCLLNLC